MSESTRPFRAVMFLGAGTMGGQISLVCALRGYPVWLTDADAGALGRAAACHREELARRFPDADHEATLARCHYTTDLAEAARQADLVIEAVPERLEVKRAAWANLGALCPAEMVIASNCSSLRVSLIEDVISHPERALNMHFYAPVLEKPMADLMRGKHTSDEVLERARRFIRSLGMLPLMVKKESTGMIYNRVWRAVKKECLKVVAEGVATPEDVDRAWMIFTGAVRGPFGMMDIVGLDVIRDIEMVYAQESGDPDDLPPPFLGEMIARGELGVKTGSGFYTYPGPAFEQPGWLMDEEEPDK